MELAPDTGEGPAVWGDEVAGAVIEAAPDGMILVDDHGIIRLANHQAEQMFGYAREDLVGKAVEQLVPERFRGVHTAHRTRYRADPHARPMGEGMLLHGQRKDGTEISVEISLSPLRRSGDVFTVAAIRDVSERFRAEAEARVILDSTPDGVFILDPVSLRFTYANVGATGQLGYSREELLQMTPLHVAPELREKGLREMVDPVAAGELAARTFSSTFRRRDGVDLPVEVSLQLLPPQEGAHDQEPSIVLVARDRSERVELAETQTERDLLADRERIARDLHDTVIQRLFAAGMSLQAVAGRAVLDEVRGRIQEVVRELDTTITDIRTTIFDLQATAPSRLRSLVAEVVDEFGDGFDGGIHVRFDGPVDTMDDHVAGHLVSVLREAMTNVVRHSAASEAEVEVRVDDGSVTATVRDDGVGVPADPRPGNGLENMAARAEELGGECRIERRDPHGTELFWRVPLSG